MNNDKKRAFAFLYDNHPKYEFAYLGKYENETQAAKRHGIVKTNESHIHDGYHGRLFSEHDVAWQIYSNNPKNIDELFRLLIVYSNALHSTIYQIKCAAKEKMTLMNQKPPRKYDKKRPIEVEYALLQQIVSLIDNSIALPNGTLTHVTLR